MKNVGEIWAAFGGPAAASRATGLKQSTITEMARNGSIPAKHHKLIVSTAETLGIEGITPEVVDAVCAPDPVLTAAE